jgi:hypothetical protein
MQEEILMYFHSIFVIKCYYLSKLIYLGIPSILLFPLQKEHIFDYNIVEVINMLGKCGLAEDINKCPHYIKDKEGCGSDHTGCGFFRNPETKKK